MKKIYLIDGNSFIYRMFFALPEFATKDGKIVNATFWMAKFFVESLVKQKPDYLIFIKDAKGKNFRHELYDDYKATRDRMPDNLKSQISDIETMIWKMGIPIIEKMGFEADDIIGTLATQLGKNPENQVYILSGDKDLYSLITKNVFVYDTMKRKVFNPEKATEKFGVAPKMIIDYLAIVGDSADNIPGISGFWPKKAVGLINEIGSVEEIYQEVEKVEAGEKKYSDFEKSIQSCFKGKTFEKLKESKEDAFLSKKLATIPHDVEIEDFSLENHIFQPETLKNEAVVEMFREFEFFSLLWDEQMPKKQTWEDLGLQVQIIDGDEELEELFEKIEKEEQIILDTETTSLNPFEADICGVSLYLDDENIFYINHLHKGKQVSKMALQSFLKNILDLDILIVGHNLKYDLQVIETFLESKNIQKQAEENVQNSLF